MLSDRKVTLAAAGATKWITPVKRGGAEHYKGLGLGLTFSVDANMTVSVQHTFDRPQAPRQVTIARVGTTATVTDPGHGLATGDNVQVDPSDTTFGGSWDVTVVDANTYTFTLPNSGATAATPTLQSFRVFNHATLNAIAGPARQDGNYSDPIAGIRLKATAYTAGVAELTVLDDYGA